MTNTTVTLIGNVTREPELRHTPAGHPVVNFSIAVNHRKKQGDEWIDDGTSFYDCAAWRSLAENVAGAITKGQRVIVVGNQRLRKYERPDGSTGLAIDIQVDEIGPAVSKANGQQAPKAPDASSWGTSAPTQQQGGGDAWGTQEAPF